MFASLLRYYMYLSFPQLLSKLNLRQTIPTVEKASSPRLAQSLYDTPDTTKVHYYDYHIIY